MSSNSRYQKFFSLDNLLNGKEIFHSTGIRSTIDNFFRPREISKTSSKFRGAASFACQLSQGTRGRKPSRAYYLCLSAFVDTERQTLLHARTPFCLSSSSRRLLFPSFLPSRRIKREGKVDARPKSNR